MKTKLKIDLLYKGQENENLATIIAQNNAGINPVSLQDISSYLWVRRSIHELYLKDNKDVFAEFEEDNDTKLHIYEKGKIVAVIEEITLEELQPNEEVQSSIPQ